MFDCQTVRIQESAMAHGTTFTDVEAHACSEDGDLLLLLEAGHPRCGSLSWFRAHRAELRTAIDRYGAVVFRGFDLDTRGFEDVMDIVMPEPFEMLDVVTPRSHVRDTLYTSTQAHPTIDIVQHQEMSYHDEPPHYLGFYCELPSETGGLTPVNDLRRLGAEARRRFPAVVDKLVDVGVLFIRNFNQYSFKSWQTCWEATTHEEAEAKLRRQRTEWEWVNDDWLRTYQRRPAILRDPASGGEVLYPSFNIFHHTFVAHIAGPQNVPLPTRASEQPLLCSFGDRSPIPEDFLTWVRTTCHDSRVSVPWRERDFSILSNLVVGHGRTPFTGPRTVHASFRGRIRLEALKVTRDGRATTAAGHAAK